MQEPDEKVAAIASLLWLLPEHYTMLRLNRQGMIDYCNELEQGELSSWRPPLIEEFEGWPVEKVQAWWRYQRGLSAKYRLWAVGLALQKLEKEHREQYIAVVMECVEDGVYTWYEPERISKRCRAGLEFMAADIPGDVPFFQELVVSVRPKVSAVARNRRIVEMAGEGISKAKIVKELGCSRTTVNAVLSGQRVRSGRMVSASG